MIKNRFGKYHHMNGGRIVVNLKNAKPLLCKSSFREYHNTEWSFFMLSIIFGIKTFYWLLQGMGIVSFTYDSFHLINA